MYNIKLWRVYRCSNSIPFIYARTEIEWKESRELELRTASGNIFSNEIDDIKRKLKGDIDKVKKKLKSELEQSKANYSEKYASKLKVNLIF